jgi:hypothetical protein
LSSDIAEPSVETIEDLVKRALGDLLYNDSFILEIDANERTITHKLAAYLEKYFDDRDIDCEYNKKAEPPEIVPKELTVEPKLRALMIKLHPKDKEEWEEKETITVYPDIIVHERGTPNNYLIIEVKKSTNPDSSARQFDEEKITL